MKYKYYISILTLFFSICTRCMRFYLFSPVLIYCFLHGLRKRSISACFSVYAQPAQPAQHFS